MIEESLTADLAAISDVINRYSLAMDSGDWSLMDRVFTPDATISLNGTPFVGRATAVGAIRIFIQCCSLAHHMNSNVVIRSQDGDAASVISNFRAWHRGKGDRAGETFETLGTYADSFVRTAQGWRIARRDESSPIVFGDYSFFDAALPRIEALLKGED
jgi:ketosteroid isomerase-like protein